MDVSVTEDVDLDKFIARVDFYEACVEQLKRELPKYLNKQNESDKYHRNFAKTLRAVASSEPNQRLRDLLFLYSQKHETFEKEREIFSTCDKAAHAIIEEARTMLIHPVKDIIADQKSVTKLTSAGGKAPKAAKSDTSDAEFVQGTLQIHSKMFEKHRLHSMRTLLRTLLSAELRYHCRVVEEVSAVLQELALVEDTV